MARKDTKTQSKRCLHLTLRLCVRFYFLFTSVNYLWYFDKFILVRLLN